MAALPKVDALRRQIAALELKLVTATAAAAITCPAKILSGTRKGAVCGGRGRDNGWCGRHQRAKKRHDAEEARAAQDVTNRGDCTSPHYDPKMWGKKNFNIRGHRGAWIFLMMGWDMNQLGDEQDDKYVDQFDYLDFCPAQSSADYVVFLMGANGERDANEWHTHRQCCVCDAPIQGDGDELGAECEAEGCEGVLAECDDPDCDDTRVQCHFFIYVTIPIVNGVPIYADSTYSGWREEEPWYTPGGPSTLDPGNVVLMRD